VDDEAATEPLQQSAPFDRLGLSAAMLATVGEMGFIVATPIQAGAIPPALRGQDVIGQAHTGSGKTAAFGIPIIEQLDPRKGSVQALILCPTRELAVQVHEVRGPDPVLAGDLEDEQLGVAAQEHLETVGRDIGEDRAARLQQPDQQLIRHRDILAQVREPARTARSVSLGRHLNVLSGSQQPETH